MGLPRMPSQGKGKYVEVALDSSYPRGWRKEVYKVNGRVLPQWTIWYDPEGKKYFKEEAVKAKLASSSTTRRKTVLQDISSKEIKGSNLKKDKVCHVCGKTFYQRNNVKRHLKNVHDIV